MLTYNCQGLNDSDKQDLILDFIFFKQSHLTILTELKLTAHALAAFRKKTMIRGYFLMAKRYSKIQVALIVSPLLHKYITGFEASENYASITLNKRSASLTIIGIYYPAGPEAEPALDMQINRQVQESMQKQRAVIITGDLNVAIRREDRIFLRNDGQTEQKGGCGENQIFKSLLNQGFSDVWIAKNPGVTQFTHKQILQNGETQSRLDYFLSHGWISPFCNACKIIDTENPCKSTHVPIQLDITWPVTHGKKIFGRNIPNTKACDESHWNKFRGIIAVTHQETNLPYNDEPVEISYRRFRENIIGAARNSLPFKKQKKTEKRRFFPSKIQFFIFRISKIRNLIKKSRPYSEKLNSLAQGLKTYDPNLNLILTESSSSIDSQLKSIKKNLKRSLKALKKSIKEERIQKVLHSRSNFSTSKANAKDIINSVLDRQKTLQSIESVLQDDANLIVMPEQVKEAVESYFTTWFNPTQTEALNEQTAYHEPATDEMDILQPITLIEILSAMRQMGKGKAPGISGITLEMMLNLPTQLMEFLEALFNNVIRQERCPQEWCRNLILPIPKSTEVMGNLKLYRPIVLMEVPKKIFMAIITQRIWKKLDEKSLLTGINYGYAKGISANLAIMAIKAASDEATRNRKGLLIAKLDARRAFDSVPPSAIKASLERIGCPSSLVRLIMFMYSIRTAIIFTAYGETKPIRVSCGIEQGGMESPLFWILTLEPLLNLLNQANTGFKGTQILQGRGTISLEKLKMNNVTFVDDITLVASTAEEMQQQLSTVKTYLNAHNIHINLDKSLIIANRFVACQGMIDIHGVKFSNSHTLKILGTAIDIDGKYPDQEHEKAIQNCFAALDCIDAKFLEIKMHQYILNSILLPKLAYEVGPYIPRQKLLIKLDSRFRCSILRCIRGNHAIPNSLIFHTDGMGYKRPSSFLRSQLLLSALMARTKTHFYREIFLNAEIHASVLQGKDKSLLMDPIQCKASPRLFESLSSMMAANNMRLLPDSSDDAISDLLGPEYGIYKKLLLRNKLTTAQDIWDTSKRCAVTTCPKNFLRNIASTGLIQNLRNRVPKEEFSLMKESNGQQDHDVYTDGSYDPETNHMGGGYLRQTSEDRSGKSFSIDNEDPSSTQAEVIAIFTAIKDTPQGTNLRIFTDSQNAITRIKENFKIGEQDPVAQSIRCMAESHKISLKLFKVKAHTNLPENDAADSLAKAGLHSSIKTEFVPYASKREPLLLVSNHAYKGRLRTIILGAVEEVYLKRSHKRDQITAFLKNLPGGHNLKKATIESTIANNKPAIAKFNILRLVGELPVSAKKALWYGEPDHCRLCSEFDDHDHILECSQVQDTVDRLFQEFDLISKSYNPECSTTLQDFKEFSKYGYIRKAWIDKYVEARQVTFKKEMILGLYRILSQGIFEGIWRRRNYSRS